MLCLERCPDIPVAPQDEACLTLKLEKSLVGYATFQKTPISPSTQGKSRCPGTSLNATLRMKSQHEGVLTPRLQLPEKDSGAKYNLTSGLTHLEQHKRQAEFCASTQDKA